MSHDQEHTQTHSTHADDFDHMFTITDVVVTADRLRNEDDAERVRNKQKHQERRRDILNKEYTKIYHQLVSAYQRGQLGCRAVYKVVDETMDNQIIERLRAGGFAVKKAASDAEYRCIYVGNRSFVKEQRKLDIKIQLIGAILFSLVVAALVITIGSAIFAPELFRVLD